MFHSLTTQLYLIFARRHDQQQGRLPDKHSINPNLGAGGNAAKKQFARMLAGVLFQGLPIGDFGPLNDWS